MARRRGKKTKMVVMMDSLGAKKAELQHVLRALGNVVVAYSGGVDSSFLAAAAHEALGHGSLAVTASSPALAQRDLDAAAALAAERGWSHRVVATKEVELEAYARNAPDRCYWCKTELFETLAPIAGQRGARLAVGTTTDDLGDLRPGRRAARENAVAAPLVDAALSKQEIRELSRQLGLPTADKPASPCLSSRFAYGVRVTEKGLRRIELAEEAIRALGFDVLRVRDHGELARIEVPAEDIARAAALKERIAAALLDLGFVYVSLDLVGFRSGSLNEVLRPPRIERT